MKILFVQRLPFLNIGTMLLSAALKRAGHEAEVLVAGDRPRLEHAAAVARADLLGFLWVTGADIWLKEFLSRLPARPPLVVGGPHPTFVPQDTLAVGADFAIRGEADEALPALMSSLRASREVLAQIKNLCLNDGDSLHIAPQRQLVEDLDSLPFQDAGIYARLPYLKTSVAELYPAMTSRGCPHSCSYCFNKKFREMHRGLGKYTRRRSPANVVEELLKAKRDCSLKRVIFEDDSFIVSKPWLEEFSEMYAREVRLPFVCQTPASSLDAGAAETLTRMGCATARIGVETADEANRRKILRKNVDNKQIIEAAAALHASGVMIQTYNMVGIPGEGFEQALQTMTLNRKIKSDFTWVSFYRRYPGTDLWDESGGGGAAEGATQGEREGFFTPSSATFAERKLANIGMLMQFFNATRTPLPVVRLISALPLSAAYALIHKVCYALSIKKINRLGWLPFIKISVKFNKFF